MGLYESAQGISETCFTINTQAADIEHCGACSPRPNAANLRKFEFLFREIEHMRAVKWLPSLGELSPNPSITLACRARAVGLQIFQQDQPNQNRQAV